MPEFPQQVKDLFGKALKISSEGERAKFLDEQCTGNEPLRLEVEALLAALQKAGNFLDNAAPSYSTIEAGISEVPGSQIGPFKLLQEIGQGGMGIVFLAEQQEPVRRKVALKIIKPGMDSKSVLARFEAERHALSLMDHPNIAKVLDAGTTAGGRPYFVMELVKGQPITQYCDDHKLTPRQGLELLLPVCHAIQHAHQKGIIHRDIKPSNILVAEFDRQPVPKVIDFGVAKAINQPLTDKTMFTGFGQVVGTLEYMSPEQARINQLDIDTRSDIYSLGFLLYELLTGTTPFDRKRLHLAAWDEMLRIIREEEPPKPSTRLSNSIESLPSISARRHTEPTKLTRIVRGELDWIVMKTLDKDRNRRYETANGLAMDLQRYLEDEAVQACPPSAKYRLRKFARRNKVAMVTTSLVSIALVLGTVVSIWQAVRATQARNEAEVARNEEATQRALADKQRAEADDQRSKAERNLKGAIRAVDQFLTRIGDEKFSGLPQADKLRKELLEDALRYYQDLLRDNSTYANLQLETAQAYRRIAAIHSRLGQFAELKQFYHQAFETLKKLVAEAPREPKFRSALADVHFDYGETLWVQLQQFEEAERELRHAVVLYEQLMTEYPEEWRHRVKLASALRTLARAIFRTNHNEAQAYYRRALRLIEEVVASNQRLEEAHFLRVYLYFDLAFIFTEQPEDKLRIYREGLTLN